MRLLGASLQGVDKIISDGLILLINGRPPKRRERAPVAAKVREPVHGSYELWALWEATKGMLPLGLPKASDLAGHFMGQWWDAVIAKFSGNTEAMEKAIQAMADMSQAHLTARDANEARIHEERMAYIGVVRETLAMQGRAIEQFASPVGPSVEAATIYPIKASPALLTTSAADAIRETLKLEWQPIAEMILRTDGFKFHTSGLSVENPEHDGFLMAKVSDPKFDDEENVYTEAAQRRSAIAVLARKGYKGENLAVIEIVEFRAFSDHAGS
jgi:hypothetical protein